MDFTENENFQKIIETIKERNKFLIVSDSDEDGVSSAVQMVKILERLSKDYNVFFRLNRRFDQDKLEKAISKNNPEIVIYLDSPYNDALLINIAKKYKNIKFIYIDHHKREIPKSIPNNLLYFDIRALFNLKDEEVTSVAGIVYRVGKHIFKEEFKKYSIVGLIGAIGDWMVYQDDVLFKDVVEEYPSLFLNGRFPSLNLMVLYTFIRFLEPNKRFDVLYSIAENLMDSIKSVDINNISSNIKSFFKTLKDLKTIYNGKKVIIFRVDGTTSDVATFVSSMIKKVVVIISKKANNKLEEIFPIYKFYKISLRNNFFEDIDVGKIMANYPKKIHGGGHQAAAGGLIKKEDLEDFINYLIKTVEGK